jgi:hypothetical protein
MNEEKRGKIKRTTAVAALRNSINTPQIAIRMGREGAYNNFVIHQVLIISAIVVDVIGCNAEDDNGAYPVQEAGEKDERT